MGIDEACRTSASDIVLGFIDSNIIFTRFDLILFIVFSFFLKFPVFMITGLDQRGGLQVRGGGGVCVGVDVCICVKVGVVERGGNGKPPSLFDDILNPSYSKDRNRIWDEGGKGDTAG